MTLLKVLASAVPLGFVALAYARVRATGEPFFGLDAKALGLGANLEYLVLHSIGFLGLLALIRPPRAELAALKWILVALVTVMYLNAARKMGGQQGQVLFVSLTAATYLGFFLNFTTPGAALCLAMRWLVNSLLLGIAGAIVGLESDLSRVAWSAPGEGLRLGQWLFALMLAVELTGLYHLRFWQSMGETLARVHRDAMPASQDTWRQKIVLGPVPLVGTVVICALPLLAAQALSAGLVDWLIPPAGESLDERVASMRGEARLHRWGPIIATGALLAGRCAQLVWLVNAVRPDADRRWWQRRGLLALLAAVGAAYIATGWWQASDGMAIARKGMSPAALYGHFVLIETLLLAVMVPQTWQWIVRRLRGA